MKEHTYTAVFEQDGEWWIGWVEELPGANTQGKTLDEARESLVEAVQMTLEANRRITLAPSQESPPRADHPPRLEGVSD